MSTMANPSIASENIDNLLLMAFQNYCRAISPSYLSTVCCAADFYVQVFQIFPSPDGKRSSGAMTAIIKKNLEKCQEEDPGSDGGTEELNKLLKSFQRDLSFLKRAVGSIL
jgi:hypothetical protein